MNTKNIVIICVTVIFIGIFFWPTLYRYEKIKINNGFGGGTEAILKINRITGYTEICFGTSGWMSVEDRN